MNTQSPKRLQLSLRTLLLLVAAFAFGFVSRNLADGLHPFYVGLTLPASTSPVRIGEVLTIDCLADDSIDRDVTVLSDRTIIMPLVGTIDVDNQSTAQIEATLNKSFAKFFAKPEFQVFRSPSQTK